MDFPIKIESKNMRKIYILFLLYVCVVFVAQAQDVSVGETYSLAKLSQEPVKITRSPLPDIPKEIGDTTFTIYKNSSVPIKTYFVHGEQYDNIFNPNPTGLYLGKQHFNYYCGLERSIKQYFSNILEIFEFSYLGNNYLMIINFREDCMGDGCRYRCYNLFDLSGRRIRQISFSSVFEGTNTFGDFNSDGQLDFVRVAPKATKDSKRGELIDTYLLTAYTLNRGKPSQLVNKEKSAYYIFAKGDEMAEKFQVIQADWFFTLKDTTGKVAPNTSYFAPYISFDPLYRYLYNPEGIRIEKNRWSVHVKNLRDLEAAQDFCREMSSKSYNEMYIMIDQYSNEISYQVLFGNFVSKDRADKMEKSLNKEGIGTKGLADFQNGY